MSDDELRQQITTYMEEKIVYVHSSLPTEQHEIEWDFADFFEQDNKFAVMVDVYSNDGDDEKSFGIQCDNAVDTWDTIKPRLKEMLNEIVHYV
jgi:hypothetical protein